MTDKSAREVIAGAVLSVCSDGNSDNKRVASDILAALEAGGFAVVPKEPTEEMFKAYYHAMDGTHPTATMNPKRALVQHHIKARKRWSAMLAAIPAPTLQPAGK